MISDVCSLKSLSTDLIRLLEKKQTHRDRVDKRELLSISKLFKGEGVRPYLPRREIQVPTSG